MSPAMSWLQFRLGEQTHALDASVVRQVVRAPRLTPLPKATMPAIIPGILPWQGRPLLVLDLGACLLHRPSLAVDDPRFLVWTQAQHAGVLAVDAVGALIRLSATTLTRHWAPVRPGLPPPWSAICGLLHAADAPDAAAADWGDSPVAVFDVRALWQACWHRLCATGSETRR